MTETWRFYGFALSVDLQRQSSRCDKAAEDCYCRAVGDYVCDRCLAFARERPGHIIDRAEKHLAGMVLFRFRICHRIKCFVDGGVV